MSLRSKTHGLVGVLLEVLLITIGVFLALLANNWHEEREHRAQARAALQNFLAEMQTNLKTTQANRSYHETLARELKQLLTSNEPVTEERLGKEVHFSGIRPVIFEHTAWDLAIATQALSYLEPGIAFDISKVYTQQSAFQTYENNFLATAFTPGSLSENNVKALATAMTIYLGDVNVQEPAIINRYEQVIPKVQSVLQERK